MTIDELKAQIDSTIKSNGQRLITGAQLNSILNAIATYTAEVEGVSLKVPQFLPFDSIITNADVQVGSTSATDYEIVYVESKNVFTAYTGGVYYTDWVGSLSYNKGTFSKSAIATNLYINPYAEIYKIENSKLVAIQKYDIANVVATYGDGLATLSYKGSAIYPETKGSQVKLSIGGNADDAIKQNSSNIVKEKERAQQVEMYLESQKANKTGYYENLSVGVSDNLSGRGEATESEFSFRPSGGENKSIEDGTARINTIKGNSVVWNCEYKNGSVATKMNINDGFLYRRASYISLSQNKGDKIYICQTINNKVDLRTNANALTRTFGYNSTNKAEFVVGGMANSLETNPSFFTKGVHTFATIHTVGDYAIDTIYCDLQQEDGITDYSEYSVKLINLTKMFGAGNEPTTVEEFESLYGNMPNEYNEGEIKNNHTTAIKSVGVNAWDEEWIEGYINANGIFNNGGGASIMSKGYIKVCPDKEYYCKSPHETSIRAYDDEYNLITIVYGVHNSTFYTPTNCRYILFTVGSFANPYTPAIYNHDICIHLVHTGYLNGKYFPYESQTRQLPTVEGGLKSAGTAYDEIRYNKSKDKWEHVQRIGIVDLGELEWYYGNPSGNAKNVFYSENVKTKLGITPAQGDALKPNILSVNYISKVPYDTLVVETVNKAITAWANQAELYRIVVSDTAYTDATTFKQAMQRVILYYELATPKVTELDVDISPDYKVWDYGTEEAISEVLSTPVRINTNYGFNAVGQITDNTELIKELLARVAVLEAQVAQANSANVEPIEPVVE